MPRRRRNSKYVLPIRKYVNLIPAADRFVIEEQWNDPAKIGNGVARERGNAMRFEHLVSNRGRFVDRTERAKEMPGPRAARAGVVGAAEGEDVLPFPEVDARLLAKLATHRVERGFAGLDFPAQSVELPRLPRRAALADEQHARAVGGEEEAADVFLDGRVSGHVKAARYGRRRSVANWAGLITIPAH